ncbi:MULTISPECIES: permease-like cell division protein FtsX [unclassified Breznakia]|uniref:permease-like cell division protein FtsX n=1 Tax=unclassified Breznakia TaxID=2623764 RepID=UPI002475D344|nr:MULTISPECIES: permease-like cell division protein FtsX [unclassified Breznakia]MDH6366606.1 cell division transport system permease protein [Breznakia sp. PH1-1]MDH6403699.1 cell division transport system permease protein [Breznakia sp. PF1-11]MDH6411408.1 cell division transport system permease protein [Breznakia sp. PFB1-11]MDH6413861.1 cell division transport system permease protein [Breznakia sp. PFB1-14]MDH6416291.1 cell division transport system permease protein [Breznakia sp. PFB1-4]
MIRAIKSIPYNIKKACKSIVRNLGASVSSIFAVTVTLILIMLFAVAAFNVSSFTTNIETHIQVLARVDTIVEDSQIPELEAKLKSIDHVTNVRYSSASEQLDLLINDEKSKGKYNSFKNSNPLPAAFYVDADEGKNVPAIKKKILEMDGIMDANYGGDSVNAMIKGFNSIRIYGGIFIAALSFLAMFLISNTIKINIHNRREEIAIMRNVGASNGFIKAPFLFEGIFIGILGSIIPILLTIFGYGYVYDMLGGHMLTSMFTLLAPLPFVVYLSGILLAIGIFVGFIGSLLAINKNLKWKR